VVFSVVDFMTLSHLRLTTSNGMVIGEQWIVKIWQWPNPVTVPAFGWRLKEIGAKPARIFGTSATTE
jgi:hypothetical protein